MNEHVKDLLGAYQDGELDEHTLQQVEEHLAGCSDCRHSLHEVASLSALLHRAPAPRPRQTARAFAANLVALLPARDAVPAGVKSNLHWGWLALPMLLLIVGVILVSSSWITTLLLLGNQSGLLGDPAGLLPASAGQGATLPLWYAFLQSLLNANFANFLATLQTGWEALGTFVLSLAGEALLALIYLAWLALVWNKRPILAPSRVTA